MEMKTMEKKAILERADVRSGFRSGVRAGSGAGSVAANIDSGLRAHMLSVFAHMAAAMVVSGVVSGVFGHDLIALMSAVPGAAAPTYLPSQFVSAIYAPPIIYAVMFAPLVMVMFFSRTAASPATAAAFLMAFAAVMGASLGTVVATYTAMSVATAFFAASAAFLSAAIVGYTTRVNIAPMGSFLMMGVFGLIAGSIVNLFLGAPALSFAISALTVLIFSALTAWDMQRIKVSYLVSPEAPPPAAASALGLYINFVNIMLALLNLFGSRR